MIQIQRDDIYLIEVAGKLEEVSGKDILQAYLLERLFQSSLKSDSEADLA